MNKHTLHEIAIATAVGIALIAFGIAVPAKAQSPGPAVEANKFLQEKRDDGRRNCRDGD